MSATRSPRAELRPFVKSLWASAGAPSPATRELVLPSGTMHVVVRLDPAPLRVFDEIDSVQSRTFGTSVIGGPRSRYYVKDVSTPSASVGAELHPGAAEALFGVPAGALAETHTPLDEVVGAVAGELRDRLFASRTAEARVAVLEAFLLSRLPRRTPLHPAVADALAWFRQSSDVREAVRRSGYSHRRFSDVFRSAVGLSPKLYCRVTRWYGVLGATQRDHASWADLAFEAGYSDQPHLHRDFRDFAGMSPGRYRALCPDGSRHVSLDGTSIPSKTRG